MQDEQKLMQIRDDGFKLGFDEGKEQAEFEVHSQLGIDAYGS